MIGSHGGNLYGFMLYIYISYIYIYYIIHIYIYIYAHMYAVYIQSVLTYIFHLWGLSNVKVSLRRAEIASTANNGIIIIVDLFLFSVVFFPLVFIQSNLTKKDAQDELVFSFLCLSSLISLCYGQLPRCCPGLSSRHLCTQEEFYQGYSRLVNFTEVSAGWRRAVVRCGLSWSHDCDELSFNKRTRKGHKSFKIFTFEVCGKFFHWSLELNFSRHSFFQRLQQSDGVATAWAKSWSIFFGRNSWQPNSVGR